MRDPLFQFVLQARALLLDLMFFETIQSSSPSNDNFGQILELFFDYWWVFRPKGFLRNPLGLLTVNKRVLTNEKRFSLQALGNWTVYYFRDMNKTVKPG